MAPKKDVWDPVKHDESAAYDAALRTQGLKVVEVYSTWAGPCSSVLPTFRKLIEELDERPLTFITAVSETIDALEEFKGRSEPTFLIFRNGRLLETVRGANTPALCKVITANCPLNEADDDLDENPLFLAWREEAEAQKKA